MFVHLELEPNAAIPLAVSVNNSGLYAVTKACFRAQYVRNGLHLNWKEAAALLLLARVEVWLSWTFFPLMYLSLKSLDNCLLFARR